MQTTIRVEGDVAKMLEELKNREKLKSYNDVIKKLLQRKELSMFGASPELKKWKESEDRARFRGE